MQYRKLTADKIFDGFSLLENHVLVVDENGMVEALRPTNDAENDIEYYNGIIIPGLINCHCHLELSHMKGLIPEKTGLVDFVYKVVTERHHDENEMLMAIVEAEEEMIGNGIIAVGDICNNTLTISQKRKGRLNYFNFIEASGWLPSLSEQRFQRAKSIYAEFVSQLSVEGCQGSFMYHSIVPHAPYSVSQNLWEQISSYFQNNVVSIHNQETAFEDTFFLDGGGDFKRMYQLMNIDNSHHYPTGKSSLQSYFEKLLKASKILLVHNSFTKNEDINFVQSRVQTHGPETFFCICINANLYIENCMPPVDLLRAGGCKIVLGTDSLASNWSLDIVAEIKTIRKYFPHIPLPELLQWATINGARALQMDSRLGSFEKGKRPGVNILDEKRFFVRTIF